MSMLILTKARIIRITPATSNPTVVAAGDQMDELSIAFETISNPISTISEGETCSLIPEAFAASCRMESIIAFAIAGPLSKIQ